MIEVDENGPVKGDPVRASVGMGFKRNMGNYESMDIHVNLSASAAPGETAKDVFNRVYEFVEARLVEKFTETEDELKKRGLGEA